MALCHQPDRVRLSITAWLGDEIVSGNRKALTLSGLVDSYPFGKLSRCVRNDLYPYNGLLYTESELNRRGACVTG